MRSSLDAMRSHSDGVLAVAASMLTAISFMLRDGTEYRAPK
jgi:hypothetical protein